MIATRLLLRPSRLLISHRNCYSSSNRILCSFNNTRYLNHSFNNLNNGNYLLNNNAGIKLVNVMNLRRLSDDVKEKALSAKEKLKKAVAEYGTTVIVFHVSISLISLGFCYFLVSNGLDVERFFQYFGFENKLSTGAGVFVAAYAVHKVFAPARMGITLAATPFIVRYLRRIGFLKMKQK